jgi:rhodanese-related sulfurtransferase
MMLPLFRSFLLSALILLSVTNPTVDAVIRFGSAEEFHQALMEGQFDVIIDTRNPSEWAQGHIENATFLDSLQRFNTSSQMAIPADLFGCRHECRIVVYCSSGNRAQGAATVLEEAGFHAPIYNGLGVSQWVAAGYDLVTTPSVNPTCNQTTSDVTTIGKAAETVVPKSCLTGEPMPCSLTETPGDMTGDEGDDMNEDDDSGAISYATGVSQMTMTVAALSMMLAH